MSAISAPSPGQDIRRGPAGAPVAQVDADVPFGRVGPFTPIAHFFPHPRSKEKLYRAVNWIR